MKTDMHFVDGAWVKPVELVGTHKVVNPATEEVVAEIALGGAADVDRAVKAAAAAFPAYSQTSVKERLALLDKIIAVYTRRFEEIAKTISVEIGSPIEFSRKSQTQIGLTHFEVMRDILAKYEFEKPMANGTVRKEPVGVCALITPWNWPSNQVALKVAPALATGCTMVLKPSEFSPLTALIFAEILEEAGVPKGVFNLVNGRGEDVGAALAAHPLVDMVSITGSTRAGIAVAEAAAPTIKRVTQELGGKSANIILDDADLEKAIPAAVGQCFVNCGQSCSAATRLIVPRSLLGKIEALAKTAAEGYKLGDPLDEGTQLGPVVSGIQWGRIQDLLNKGVVEGAKVVTGGPGKPEGFETGFYVKPTIFSEVTRHMAVAQEEIFGPALVVLAYDSKDEAVEIANDSKYGLSGYVWGSPERVEAVARRLQTGTVCLNGAKPHPSLPFGGYKQSGNGREKGVYGFEEYLEVKTIAR